MVEPRGFRARTPLLLLMLLTLVAYGSVLARGGFIWDDPDYVTHNPLIRDADGLVRIWTEPRALPQYYPLVHTTYWVEYQLWGLHPAGYHATNVLLHGGSAILFYLALRRLRVPGAWAAAAIFAVHPVTVESVAWVTERKNTLSLFLYLAAFLAYWRQASTDPSKRRAHWAWYAAALALFCGAMLSKTVACSFPAAVVLVLWWKRGRVTWGDLARLAPFFAIGAGLGVYTAYLERSHVGATGKEFDFTPVDRVLIASRAVWFYLGKLACPWPLSFIYRRWEIDPRVWWQWVQVAGCLAVTAALVAGAWRRGWRGPLVAWLFFVGTLVPALGFFNVYPMRYSFVADHFQYHAALGIFALAGAGLCWVGRRLGADVRVACLAVLLAVLGTATFARGFAYQSARALWTDTARKNPGSWMVHVNLGHTLVEAGELDAAQREYEEAARLAPDQPEALINVGGMLSKRGHYDAAMAQYRRALDVRPNYPPALYGIGDALLSQHKPAEARDWLERAVKQDPTYEQAQYKLGVAREQLGDLEGARAAYEASAAADPEEADAMYNLGNLYLSHRAPDAAAYWLGRAVAVRPGWPQAHANLGSALWQMGRRREAVDEYATAARLDPQLGQGIRSFLSRQGINLPDGGGGGAR